MSNTHELLVLDVKVPGKVVFTNDALWILLAVIEKYGETCFEDFPNQIFASVAQADMLSLAGRIKGFHVDLSSPDSIALRIEWKDDSQDA